MPKTRYLRVIIYTVLFFLLYLVLPIYLMIHLGSFPFILLFIFYTVNILIVFFSFKRNHARIYRLKLKTQDLQEKINILNNQSSRVFKNRIILEQKIKRYNMLEKIVERINQDLTLESIVDNLSLTVFSVIADNKGVCLLYLVDPQTHVLSLFKAKKEDKKLIIRTKEGDIFDFWVLRHSSPLLIEDIKKDFRFDLEKLELERLRSISSLISAPLISEQKFLGILRLDYHQVSFYSQDDLRFLATICDLGAVALENGELFKEVQDLAIHDELTSLYTKGYFLERLEEEYKRSVRQDRNLSLLMLDIDYFKHYNDKFGHTAGDIVLKMLTQNIVRDLKDLNAIISRFGGEEFCIILSGIDKNSAVKTAEQLKATIEKMKIVLRRTATSVTVSIGVANFPDDARDEDELILKADKAMYKAKQSGRNRVSSA